MIRFSWDENKRRENLRKHGVDFSSCPKVFDGWASTHEDQRFAYDEHRFITVGLLGERGVVIAHTETEHEIRIISARYATRHEEKSFFESIG
jgi:uncharacterized protein